MEGQRILEIKALRRARGEAEKRGRAEEWFQNWDNSLKNSKANEGDTSAVSVDVSRFDLKDEEGAGHYDDEGYFIFDKANNQGQDKSLVYAAKNCRESKKRMLGIDDVDTFIAKREGQRTDSRTKFIRARVGPGKEYEDDDEEEEDSAAKDGWLLSLDDGEAVFQSASKRDKLLNAKESERLKVEARMSSRYGSHMTANERLGELLEMLEAYEARSPAELLIKIKEKGLKESTGSEAGEGRQKKGFRRAVKLKQEYVDKMNQVTDLCDELLMDGHQVLNEPFAKISLLMKNI